MNEVDLNDVTTCRENCGYYTVAKQQGCYQNQYCSQQKRCNGKVLNCQYIDSDMWICPSVRNYYSKSQTNLKIPTKGNQLSIHFFSNRQRTVLEDTSTSNMKMDRCLVARTAVLQEQQRSTVGGVGFSGTAVIVSVIVTIITPTLIVTST